ncbi:MAG: helix-turn-helix domain-containing protein [Firmicutes bacterium]|nr:helix-turn-helix domain-containing protein [Bacillota bacterium]
MHYIYKLNTLKKNKKISLRELSLSSEVPEPTIKNILTKKHSPRITSIEKLSCALDISLAQLFCNENETVVNSCKNNIRLFSLIESLPNEAKIHILWMIENLSKNLKL